MKTISTSILLILLTLFAKGQIQEGSYSNLRSLQQLSIDVDNKNFFKGVNVDGSPYLYDEYGNGVFYFKDKPSVESFIRINLYKNYFEFKSDNSLRYVDPVSIDSVLFNNKTFIYKTFEYEGKTSDRIIEKVYEKNESRIYMFTEIVFKAEVKAEGYVEPKPATFQRFDPVYILEVSNQIIPLTSFNKLFKSIPDHANAIKKYIKDYKINKNDISDLKQLIEFIDITI